MAVTGDYLALRLRGEAVPYVRAYGEWVLGDLAAAFGNLEERANRIADEEFERLGAEPAGEDCDGDMGGAAEAAQDRGQAFYDTMVALRQTTLNLLAAGLFHLVEQQLANLCHDGAIEVDPPGDSQLAVVSRWYDRHFELQLPRLPSWPAIDELRLVANVVKHAEGHSARELRELRADLFRHPQLHEIWPEAPDGGRPVRLPLAGDDLYITVQVFQQYSEAANRFLEDVVRHFEEHGERYFPRGG